MATATLDSVYAHSVLPGPAVGCYEILRGRLIEMGAPSVDHGAIQTRIGGDLDRLTEQAFPYLIAASRTKFLVEPDVSLTPDVFLIERDRLRSMAQCRAGLRGAPDLVVEIVSPGKTAFDMNEKEGLYLAGGTKTLWVVWPKTRHVMIHHANGDVRKAGLGGYLDAPDVIPGARIPVDRIFPQL